MLDFTLHLFTSYLIVALLSHRLAITEALYITLLLGLFKEQFLDVYYLKSDFSLIDMGGNIVGCVLSMFFILKIDNE